MDNSFLSHVADDLLRKHADNLSDLVIVFPNKRASLFLKQELMRRSAKPVWSPSYMTITQLFEQQSGRRIADSLRLICILHRVYCRCTGSSEPLDAFFGWGQIMLSDFDDIDKKLIDAHRVFSNVSGLREMDDISYLTEEQRQAIEHFYTNVSLPDESRLRSNFLKVWDKMEDVYSAFNAELKLKGIAYEGALYREVVENEHLSFGDRQYIFVGFNFLQEVERRMFKHLKAEEQARFYWDFDKAFIDHADHEAGLWMRRNLKEFTNELDDADDIYRNYERPKQINLMSAPTENLQARYITEWVKEGNRIADGNQTAIVLCDENLLQTVVHCLPSEVTDVNVTTGYPLRQTQAASFVECFIDMLSMGFNKERSRFRAKYIHMLLSHPYAAFILPDRSERLAELRKAKHLFYSSDELSTDEATAMLFGNPDSLTDCVSLAERLAAVVRTIAEYNASEARHDSLFQESVFRMFTLLTRLADIFRTEEVSVDIITFQRFVRQLLNATTIPFHGEPAVGLQIMGVLETRNLDFKHLLVLSCNEGNMPRVETDTSLIPNNIRYAFGLSTPDEKDSIYAYHFYRLLQRADDITIVYNTSTEKNKGQMSRYIMQMMVESRHEIRKFALLSALQLPRTKLDPVAKSSVIADKLRTIEKISPTAIVQYLRCPLQFFYHYVAELKEADDNDVEEIDNRIFGNIFHAAAQYLYKDYAGNGRIMQESDFEYLKKAAKVAEATDFAFRKELFHTDETTGKSQRPDYNGLQIINRNVIIRYLNQLVANDRKLAIHGKKSDGLMLVGLEKYVGKTITIRLGTEEKRIIVGGIIDRLDKTGSRLRVIDYKTGGKPVGNLRDIDDIFNPDRIANHSDYYLQTFLYASIVNDDAEVNPLCLPVSPGIYLVQHAGGDDYDPTLTLNRKNVGDIAVHCDLFDDKLRELLTEIFDPDTDFRPTGNIKTCLSCPYSRLCHTK